MIFTHVDNIIKNNQDSIIIKILRLAGVIILNERKEILLLHRIKRNQWELPGGKVDEGESYLEKQPIL